jgi:hypothetical protein
VSSLDNNGLGSVSDAHFDSDRSKLGQMMTDSDGTYPVHLMKLGGQKHTCSRPQALVSALASACASPAFVGRGCLCSFYRVCMSMMAEQERLDGLQHQTVKNSAQSLSEGESGKRS